MFDEEEDDDVMMMMIQDDDDDGKERRKRRSEAKWGGGCYRPVATSGHYNSCCGSRCIDSSPEFFPPIYGPK